MINYEFFPMLIKGLGTDLLITILAVIFPLIVGVGLTVLMHFTRKSALPKIFRYISILTEGLCPVCILLMTYFTLPQILQYSLAIKPAFASGVALSLCFMGYMAFRYDERDSLVKNIVVNGIGLVADMLKWCFGVAFLIGVSDLISAARNYAASTYLFFMPYFSVTVIIFLILAVLYIIRQICKDFIK